MKTPVYEYTVTIRVQRFGMGDLPGFLDMLRYEGATVLDWSQAIATDADTVRVRLRSNRPTPERWESFGIYPKDALGNPFVSYSMIPVGYVTR